MSPGFWGVLTAISWGGADFTARFTGRALGYRSSLLGMLLVGSAGLTMWVWLGDVPLVWPLGRLWLLAAVGIGTMASTLLLYNGLVRGPISVVAPIVGAYPGIVLLLSLLTGARPSALDWAGMAATMLGVVLVSRAGSETAEGDASKRVAPSTLLIALTACVCFGLTLFAAGFAIPVFGELQTLWTGRLVSLAALLALLAVERQRPALPARWWPALGLQGLLDAGGYFLLFFGSTGPGAAIAAVTSSAFGAVTTLLAWLVLRERIGAVQWLGVALIFAGAGVLSA